MKNKKGFTLVEIIAVIVILITITLMAVPTVLRLVKRNKEISYETKVAIILKQASQYARDNETFLFNSKKKYIGRVCNSITVKQLLDAGYLKEISKDGSVGAHITNPETNENLDDMSIVVYINSKNPTDINDQYIGTYVSIFKDAAWCNTIVNSTMYAYTGEEQQFVASQSGYYKLQVWGAQGGYQSTASIGGKGGYAEGIIHLDKDEVLYVYVGGDGNSGGLDGGYNGGGAGINFKGGGGATDIRVEGNTLYNRIIVAGGGGSGGRAGSMDGGAGGAGGGIDGIPCSGCGYDGGGTQTAGGSELAGFGYGEAARNTNGCGGIDGSGGGGWYGGSAGTHGLLCFGDQGGSGGSAFAYDGTNVVPDGYSVTEHFLTHTLLLSGNSPDIPTYDNTGTMTGNIGHGVARITFVST